MRASALVFLFCMLVASGAPAPTTVSAPVEMEPVVKKIPGLEALGNVKILSEMSFPKPDTSKDVSYGLDGAFSNVKLELPAGAWPEDLSEGPSMTIFELPLVPEELATDGKKKKVVAGKCINFEPKGVKFSKPVTIALPLDLSTLDLTGMMLRPHRFNPNDNSWTEIALPEGYEVPSFANCDKDSTNFTNATECRPDAPPLVIKGAIMSFSAYAALSAPAPDLGPDYTIFGCFFGFSSVGLLRMAYLGPWRRRRPPASPGVQHTRCCLRAGERRQATIAAGRNGCPFLPAAMGTHSCRQAAIPAGSMFDTQHTPGSIGKPFLQAGLHSCHSCRRNALMLPPPQTTPGLAGGRRRRHETLQKRSEQRHNGPQG